MLNFQTPNPFKQLIKKAECRAQTQHLTIFVIMTHPDNPQKGRICVFCFVFAVDVMRSPFINQKCTVLIDFPTGFFLLDCQYTAMKRPFHEGWFSVLMPSLAEIGWKMFSERLVKDWKTRRKSSAAQNHFLPNFAAM
jgi:hypothetical protein